MDKFSLPKTFDHDSFLRFFLAVESPDAIPALIWIDPLNSLLAEFTTEELAVIEARIARPANGFAGRREIFFELERKVRGSRSFADLNLAIADFERNFFCSIESGKCTRCGKAANLGGPLCLIRFGTSVQVEPVREGVDGEPVTIEETAPIPVSDPLLEYFKIPSTPGEIGGFEYDALIDSAPVVVWRPACEIERDFVEDLLAEAEVAGITRLFLIAKTELGPDKLPINPKVALILLPIPPDFGGPLGNVIETDVAYS